MPNEIYKINVEHSAKYSHVECENFIKENVKGAWSRQSFVKGPGPLGGWIRHVYTFTDLISATHFKLRFG